MRARMLSGLAVMLLTVAAFGQMTPPPDEQGPGMAGPPPGQGPEMRRREGGPMPMHDGMPGGEHMRMPGPGMPGDHAAMMGKWWKNSELVQRIGLSDQQVQQIEKIFQDHRMQLIDLHAALEKQEAIMEPLMEAERVDDAHVAQVVSQIDKIAMARAALEKSNATMLLGIRRVLTVDQWKKLHSEHMGMRMRMPAPAPPPPGNFD